MRNRTVRGNARNGPANPRLRLEVDGPRYPKDTASFAVCPVCERLGTFVGGIHGNLVAYCKPCDRDFYC